MPTSHSQHSAHISTHEDELEDTEEIQQTLPVQPPLDANPAQSNCSPSALDYVDRVTQPPPEHDRPLSPAPHQQFQPPPTPAWQQGFSPVLLTPPLIPKESRNSKNMDILQVILGIPGIYTIRILNFLHYIFNFGA